MSKDPTPAALRWLALTLVAWLLVCMAWVAQGQPVPSRAVQGQRAAACTVWLQSHLYVRESGRNNGGPDVGAIVRAGGGVPSQYPEWCGFTQAACQKANKLPIPRNGMQGAAAAWFRDINRTLYLAGRGGSADSIRVGYKVGFDYGRGIHHIGAVVQVMPPQRKGRPPRGFYSIAGNEGRFPGGVHLTYYPTPNIAASANWLY